MTTSPISNVPLSASMSASEKFDYGRFLQKGHAVTSAFTAYASGNKLQDTLFQGACRSASIAVRTGPPWPTLETSGSLIVRTVETWIESADAFVADNSVVKPNVSYEFGYAVGLQKPTRLCHHRRRHSRDQWPLPTHREARTSRSKYYKQLQATIFRSAMAVKLGH